MDLPKSFLHRLSTISLSFSSVSLQASHTLGTTEEVGHGKCYNSIQHTGLCTHKGRYGLRCKLWTSYIKTKLFTRIISAPRSFLSIYARDLGTVDLKMDKTLPSLVTGARLSMPAGGMHRSLSSGKRSQSNIFGQGKPNADITGAQPFLTLSHRDLHGCMGSSRSSRHTGAKREQRNFLVSG